MAGNSRIWRDSNTVPLTDIIEFNEGAVPDASGNIQTTNVMMIAAIAVNEKPKGQLDELQDTGLASVTWTITGFVEGPASSLLPNLTKEWMVEDKTTVSFPLGRFGLQLDDFPDFNVRPNSNRGIMIESWQWTREGATNGKAGFIAVVKFNSNPTGLNASTYNWDTT